MKLPLLEIILIGHVSKIHLRVMLVVVGTERVAAANVPKATGRAGVMAIVLGGIMHAQPNECIDIHTMY